MVLGFPSLRGDFPVSAFVESFHIFDHSAHLPPLMKISSSHVFQTIPVATASSSWPPFPQHQAWSQYHVASPAQGCRICPVMCQSTAQPRAQAGHPGASQSTFFIGVIHTSPHRSAWRCHPTYGSRIPPMKGDLCLGSRLPFTSGSCSTSVKIFWKLPPCLPTHFQPPRDQNHW